MWARVVVLLLVVLSLPLSAQFSKNSSVDMGSLRGVVHSGTGGSEMIKVELVSRESASSMGSQMTDRDGAFYFSALPIGEYDLVVTVGATESRQAVHVFGTESVDIRFGPSAEQHVTATSGPISVSHLRIPEKAREELQKARESLAKRDFSSAMSHVEKALATAPNYADALMMRGVMAMDANGDMNTAQQDIEAAIKADPNCQMAYVALAALKNRTGHPDDAIRLLDSAERLGPSWQLHLERGKALIAKARFPEAMKWLGKAEQGAPKFAAIFLNKARALAGMGDKVAAKQELLAAIGATRDPQELIALNQMLLKLE
jgi:Tfp pilus assembly protein PilF